MLEVREYNIDSVITFRKTNEEFGGLSNMASGFSLNINGIIIPSAEHLYQACRYPMNPEIQHKIISQRSPMTAKMISKKYYHLSRPDWDNVRIKVMRWVLEIKLSQNWSSFGQLLLRTGNLPIVEYSYKDKIWGAVKSQDNKLVGVNALGRLLMEARDKYVKPNIYLKCVEPIPISVFLLYNNEIETACDDLYRELDYRSKFLIPYKW